VARLRAKCQVQSVRLQAANKHQKQLRPNNSAHTPSLPIGSSAQAKRASQASKRGPKRRRKKWPLGPAITIYWPLYWPPVKSCRQQLAQARPEEAGWPVRGPNGPVVEGQRVGEAWEILARVWRARRSHGDRVAATALARLSGWLPELRARASVCAALCWHACRAKQQPSRKRHFNLGVCLSRGAFPVNSLHTKGTDFQSPALRANKRPQTSKSGRSLAALCWPSWISGPSGPNIELLVECKTWPASERLVSTGRAEGRQFPSVPFGEPKGQYGRFALRATV